jgi:hypothetical protein
MALLQMQRSCCGAQLWGLWGVGSTGAMGDVTSMSPLHTVGSAGAAVDHWRRPTFELIINLTQAFFFNAFLLPSHPSTRIKKKKKQNWQFVDAPKCYILSPLPIRLALGLQHAAGVVGKIC